MRQAHAPLLLERDNELAQLARLVEDACAGHGGIAVVEGPPGIGKTRLLEAVRLQARAQDMLVLSARASELDRDFPFGVVRQLFEALVAGAGADRRAGLLAGAAGLAAPLLGLGTPEQDSADAGTDVSLAHFHALYWLMANLAEEAAVALVIDDAHWADATSLRFLQFVLPRLEELPVLVAVAARRPGPGADSGPIDALATDSSALVLHPAPLSGDAVATVIAAELGEASDPGFRDACHQATGGNPFLLGELLRELRVEGIAPDVAGAPLVRELAPPTVARAVLVRLARLGDAASALTRAVAVLGDGAPLRRAATLAGLSEERASELTAALSRSDILTAARPLAFAHPILRSAVYADIDPGERASAHRRAAALLAEEEAGTEAIAVHLLATEPAADPWVTATLRQAAARAVSHGAPSTAVACLRRALAEPPPRAERASLVLELASAELHSGDPGAATEHFDEAAWTIDDPRSHAAFTWQRALALQALGRHDEAFAVLERTVEEVAAVDRELALSVEADLIASASLDRSRRGWARQRRERYRGRLTGATPGEGKLLATQANSDAFSRHCHEPAEALADIAERALATSDPLDYPQSTPFFFAINVLLLADRVNPARRALDRMLDAARRDGSAPGFAFASGWRCWLLAREGALAEAEADARSCADLALPQGWFVMGPVILGHVLDVLVDRGELSDAERLLERSGMAARAAEQDLAFDPVVHARARLRAARGDLAGARTDLARFAVRRARWNTYPTLAPAVLVAPELAAADSEDSRAFAARMVDEAHTWGTPRAIGMALRAAGLVEDGARGVALLDEAASVLEASPARLEHARALTDLGAALRRANRRTAARDPLRRALDIADACGASPLAERARHELRAAGGRPQRPRISGIDALTASERRIAAMAADGMSNPEIAQALFVTTKTVEAHLSSAYRKLDISSRGQLASALG